MGLVHILKQNFQNKLSIFWSESEKLIIPYTPPVIDSRSLTRRRKISAAAIVTIAK